MEAHVREPHAAASFLRLFESSSLLTERVAGSTDALSETLVSQFEALAREEEVAHRKGLPTPSRFKPRESVWPTPQRERGSVDTQQREFLELWSPSFERVHVCFLALSGFMTKIWVTSSH